jgi:hypothetical protein
MKSRHLFSRRQLLQGSAAVAAATLLNGRSASGSLVAKNIGRNVFQASGGSPTPATLVVTNAKTIGYINSQGFAGLSFEKKCFDNPSFFSTSSTQLMNLLKQVGSCTQLNTGVIRIGGNTADQYEYVGTNTPGTGQFGNEAILNLAAFLEATGWKCLYTINLAGAANGTNTQTPTLAAQEAAFVAGKLGGYLYGFCLGNEPDLWTSAQDYPSNWTAQQYQALWNQYRSIILAPGAAPGCPIMGPDASGIYWPSPTDWIEPFGTSENGSLQEFTQHYYWQGGQKPSNETATQLVSPDTFLTGTILPPDLVAVQNATPAGKPTIPLRISECDSFYADSAAGVADGYGSALWCINFLFTLALNGVCGANFHTNGGTETGDFTPFVVSVPWEQTGATVTSVHPEFYGIIFFSLVQWGSIYESTLTLGGTPIPTGSPTVNAYAVHLSNGNLFTVVVNSTATDYTLNLTVPGGVTGAGYQTMTQLSPGASGPSLTATDGITIQGSSIDVNSATFTPGTKTEVSFGGTNNTQIYDVPIPALSAVLIHADY